MPTFSSSLFLFLAHSGRREPPLPHFTLPDLEVKERRDIVKSQLRDFFKSLSPHDVEAVVSKLGSRAPLYLVTCCEELRLQVGARGALLLGTHQVRSSHLRMWMHGCVLQPGGVWSQRRGRVQHDRKLAGQEV